MKLAFAILFSLNALNALGLNPYAEPRTLRELEYLFDVRDDEFFPSLSALGWKNVEKHKVGANLNLLCSDGQCPYILKIMSSELSDVEFFRILNIQIELSKKDLAPRLIHYGRIHSKTGSRRFL